MQGLPEVLKEVLKTKRPKVMTFNNSHDKSVAYVQLCAMINHSQTYGCLYLDDITDTSLTIRYNHELDMSKKDKPSKKKSNDPNGYLRIFANAATAHGMSYGQLQQKETLYIRDWGKLPRSLTNEERVQKILAYEGVERWQY